MLLVLKLCARFPWCRDRQLFKHEGTHTSTQVHTILLVIKPTPKLNKNVSEYKPQSSGAPHDTLSLRWRGFNAMVTWGSPSVPSYKPGLCLQQLTARIYSGHRRAHWASRFTLPHVREQSWAPVQYSANLCIAVQVKVSVRSLSSFILPLLALPLGWNSEFCIANVSFHGLLNDNFKMLCPEERQSISSGNSGPL